VTATLLDDRALLALQGPAAATVLARFCAAPDWLNFMQAGDFTLPGIGLCSISRSGYTGEDGFEISVPNATVEKFFRALLAQPEVKPIGLGARDSLRLEAGLCLYGHDLDPNTTPIEADLVWAIGKRRRAEGGFIGASAVQQQLASGPGKRRVGIRPEGRALAREHTDILDGEGRSIGIVTSGGFGPSIDGPLCMGYAEPAFAKTGTPVFLSVRGKPLPAKIVPLPFVPHRYVKG
jgi:aminomethyltransferase